MFFAGDEFMNTAFGNNNAYCQDNIISWLDWNRLEENKTMFNFFKSVIAFRKKNVCIRKNNGYCSLGFPPLSTHGVLPFSNQYDGSTKYIGVLYAGKDNKKLSRDEIIYIGINAYWEEMDVVVPMLPDSFKWKKVIDTYEEKGYISKSNIYLKENVCTLQARSVVVLKAKKMDD